MSEAKHTPGPWFVSGVRFKMNGGEWISVNRYNEATKRDENIACVGYDPRAGAGAKDARLIAAAPDLLEALKAMGIGGDLAEEKIGWTGRLPSTPDHFKCEFCGAEHLDCTLIEHAPTCPVPLARAAVAKAEGRS